MHNWTTPYLSYKEYQNSLNLEDHIYRKANPDQIITLFIYLIYTCLVSRRREDGIHNEEAKQT